MKIGLVLFFLLVSTASAKTYILPSGISYKEEMPIWTLVKKEWILPSGLKYVSENLMPIARASDLTLREEIEMWLKSYAEQYNISEDYFYRLAKCESGLDPNAVGDKGKVIFIFQWWQKSWDFYNRKFKTDLDRENWKHQIEMSAKVISLEGYDNWVNCYYFIRFGKWK